MCYITKISLFLFLFLSAGSCIKHKIKTHHSVVQLSTEANLATGWAIDKDTIITAGHFCAWSREDEQEDGGFLFFPVPLSLTYVDDIGKQGLSPLTPEISNYIFNEEKIIDDICIVKAPNHGRPILPLGNSKSLTIGDTITAIGAPYGAFPYFSQHQINYINNGVIFFSGVVRPGHSGGPIVDKDGRVVGMIVQMRSLGELFSPLDLGVAIKIETIEKYYKEHLAK